MKPLFVQIFRTATPLFTKIGEFISTALHRLAPTLINIANIVSNILGPALKIIGPMLGKLLDVLGWILGKIASVLEGITYVFQKYLKELVGCLIK
ncbi:MAG: hypothetical protein IPG85_09760 [Bacteroidetes bacterium]|nr:hypothetical protein [Bacteroidota bacterium]